MDETNRDEKSLDLTDKEQDESIVPNYDFNEETAAEVTPTKGMLGDGRPFNTDAEEREETAEANLDGDVAGRGVGIFAIVLSVLSLFFLPVLLGAAGLIVGFVSRRNGATALGNWAIGIGAVSIIMTVFFSPFF